MTKARVKFSLGGMHRKVRKWKEKWRGKGERRKGTPLSLSFSIHAFLPPPLQFSFEAARKLSKIRLRWLNTVLAVCEYMSFAISWQEQVKVAAHKLRLGK